MSELTLIQNIEHHPFLFDYIYEFQNSFLEVFPEANLKPGNYISLKRQLLRIFRHTYRYLPFNTVVFPDFLKKGQSFSILCGGDFAYCLPSSFTASQSYLYMFDSWPRANEIIVDWVNFFSIEKVFFSALQSAELFNKHFESGRQKGVWVPEGIYAKNYYYLPYDKKDIDVIEFGRKYEKYHEQITLPLGRAGFVHHYGRVKRIDEALSRAKISICFPSSTTHPERSEYISTMTLRYLQSMVSKCLIVGELPYDMQFLFDYQPVIEIDTSNPEEQLINILRNYTEYIPLIEKNYQTVMNQHLWSHRLETIKQYML